MGKEIGKITEVNEQWMTVQLRTGEQCSVCAAKSACSFGGPDSKYRFVKVPRKAGINKGNIVNLEYRETSRIWASLIVFCLPILLLLIGYVLGESSFQSPNGGIWGALAGLAFSAPVLWILNKVLSHSSYFRPQIVGMAGGNMSSQF